MAKVALVLSGVTVMAVVAVLVYLSVRTGVPAAGGYSDGSYAKEPLGSDGTVTGVMFRDIDGDGVRDPGEPGASGHSVELEADGTVVQATTTGAGGAYSITAEDGEYTLRADAHSHAFFCADFFGGLDPLRLDDCMTPEIPWGFTTPNEVAVSINGGGVQVVNFGVRPADVAVLSGIAVLESSYAPPGSVVRAFHDGIECGVTVIEGPYVPGIHNYELAVFGAGERAGCPEPGDAVSFSVDGTEAIDVYGYQPTGTGMEVENIVAMEGFAWYWAEEPAVQGLPNPNYTADAFIDGKRCQGAFVVKAEKFSDPVIGFVGLTVASSDISPPCADPGEEVRFYVDGEPTGTTAIWEPGIHRIDIDLPGAIGSGDNDCNGTVDTLDVLAILRERAGLSPSGACLKGTGDVDCSGERDVLDALAILKFVGGIPYGLPEGCIPIGQSGP